MNRFDRIDDEDLFTGEALPPPEKPALRRSEQNDWVEAAALPTDPRAWLFAAFPSSEEPNMNCVVFTPVLYWREQRAQFDQHVSEVIGSHLPEYLRDQEEMESTFLVPNRHTLNDIRGELAEVGFQTDTNFSAFMRASTL